MLKFGQLQEALCPHARYTIRDSEHGKWKLVKFGDFRALHPRAAPSKVVLELMAQTVSLNWSQRGPPRNSRHARQITVPPQVLERADASTIYNAVEGCSSGLPLETILRLGQKLRYVM
eukprot:11942737-Heterocapsa_arctica.AAC.1